MDVGLNVTYITLSGYVHLGKYRYLFFFIMLTLYTLIICSNSIIVYLIWTHQKLHEPMYIFIAALLINSVLFSTTVYPHMLINSLSGRQMISHYACLLQLFIFSCLGASDFFLLTVMAYDRYVSICKPLQYPTIMRKNTILIFLALAWFLPVIPVAYGGFMLPNQKLCKLNIIGFFCNSSLLAMYCDGLPWNIVYDYVSVTYCAVIPVLFILFTYSRIVIVSIKSNGEIRRKAVQTCLPHLIVLVSFSCFSAYDVIIPQLNADFSKPVRLIMTLQLIVYTPLLNPIIYGVNMKEISKHLKRFFYQHKVKSCV